MKLRSLIESYSREDFLPKKPYIIAEAGVNHEGDIDIARKLIEQAKLGGADAIKFQTYKADKIASKDSPSYWDLSQEPTDSQYKLFQKYDSFWKNEYELLAHYCAQEEIEFLSTPFDVLSAQFLNELMDVFKISSSDINNKPFIENICTYGKPLILSTGASYLWEIEQALCWINHYGNSVSLLHCILNYPTLDENANLSMLVDLKNKFPNHLIGYSDHTMPKSMKTLEVSYLLGARIIEKHFTHDKSLPGNDHYHSMDMHDLILFNENLDQLHGLLGSSHKEPIITEVLSRKNARRSLVAARHIPKGKVLSLEDITYKRPASGLDPRSIDDVIGCRALTDINEDTILQWEHLSVRSR